MDTETALRRLTNRAESAFEADEKARNAMGAALAGASATQLAPQFESALVASANAKPWHDLMKRIERHGVREGLAKQKAEVLELLLSYGLGLSTSLVTNAARLAEQDGLRRFLNVVDTIDIDEDDAPAAAELTEAPQETPEKAPASKVTPAQRRTLEAIRDSNVKLQAFTAKDSAKVTSDWADTRPRRDMVEFAIEQGWAQRDTSTPLFRGQAVTLTASGEAILAR